ncbi:thermonuclease family protein [Nostoc sp. FACHB-87]|uniref:thermonuclease family protein n=1 Tax=Nostocales TaxID=1161 RepID=UPI00168552C5|nr:MULTISPECIES: thermonuclease family protein [Nostocales]MBD2456452.1 thermonuclease family protein [Nostoc sp. FACHB-87]MBD2474004.1 thermonuclease family protein [Anabaena sp. FACHB-83]MBD2488602.1 thermonuclease family protein [Aulosira sp. FACHB-615]
MQKLTKQMVLWLSAVVMVLGLVSCDKFFGASGDLVERVSDGDTLAVKDAKGIKFNVRFACIDAPEVPHSQKERNSKLASDRNQFDWGAKAQARLQQLVQQSGDRVMLTITDSDRYGRKVAEVRLKDGTFVQEVLLKEGLAKVYRPYLNKCPSKDLVQKAEAQAQQQKLGVWSDSKFTNPWEYRSLAKEGSGSASLTNRRKK